MLSCEMAQVESARMRDDGEDGSVWQPPSSDVEWAWSDGMTGSTDGATAPRRRTVNELLGGSATRWLGCAGSELAFLTNASSEPESLVKHV